MAQERAAAALPELLHYHTNPSIMSQEMKNNRLYTYTKILAFGLIVTGLACFWLYTAIGDAWQELMLMQHHETCSGFIVDVWEDVDEADSGEDLWYSYATYTYSLTDGQQFTQTTGGRGRLKSEFGDLSEPYPIEVEYLADNPTVSRIKGEGPDTILGWLRTEVGYLAFLPLLLLGIGLYLLWQEVSELRQLRKSEKSNAYDGRTR